MKNIIRNFVKELSGNYPGIREIWLIGSRANNDTVRPDSDWDFIVFGNEFTHSLIQNDKNLQKKALNLSIDLLVEKESGEFRSVWGASKCLRLKDDLRWNIISDTTAKYWATKLVEKESTEQLFWDEWQVYFDQHGADTSSEDVSTWKYAIKVWPSD
jgi:predicted nucleotidyltransferase